MGKRKQTVPQKTSEEKKQCMTWSMVEGRLEAGSLTLVPDTDPSLLQEVEQCNTKHKSDNSLQNQPLDSTESLSPSPFVFEQLQSAFEENLKTCLFSLVLQLETALKPGEWQGEIGRFAITLSLHKQWPHLLQNGLPKCPECWLYVNDKKGCCMLYFELDENSCEDFHVGNSEPAKLRTLFYFADCDVPVDCLEALQLQRVFRLVLSKYDAGLLQAEIKVFITSKSLKELHHSSEFKKPTKGDLALQTVMSQFFGISAPSYRYLTRQTQLDVELLYTSIKLSHRSRDFNLKIDVQHPNLKPSLRPYQREAVEWMLTRENFTDSSTENVHIDDRTDPLHQLYQEVETLDKQILYYNCYLGWLVRDRPLRVRPLPGGILADEMGLGKTVEVLACMLAHPRCNVELPEPLPVAEIIQDEDSSSKTSVEEGDENTAHDKNPRDESVVSGLSEGEPPASSVHSNMAEALHEGGKQELDRKAQGIDNDSESFMASMAQSLTQKCEQETNHDPESSFGQVTDKNVNQSEISGQEVNNDLGKLIEVEVDVAEVGQKSPTELTTNTDCCEKPSADSNNKGKIKGERQKQPRKKKSYTQLVPVEDLEPPPNGFFTDMPVGPREYFECICGAKRAGSSEVDNVKVQCTKCGLWQHATCVNYDLQNPYRGHFLCPHCHVLASPVPSGATLIVSPASICHQWVEEITKHIKEKSIKVFFLSLDPNLCYVATCLKRPRLLFPVTGHIRQVYRGVGKLGFTQPRTLASHDIVITTYETLRKEIDFVDLPHSNSETGRRFRHPKRFMAIPSPLTAVQWWRICLDEAQMVECVTTRTASMALRLSAVNRWCVTGTPVQKDIQDLYGLMVFLGEDPYWVQGWWNRLLYEPLRHGIQEPLYQAVSNVMWRTAKKDVIEQIQLPGQSEQIKWLTFSPVEDHFYRRQYQTCMREASWNLFRRTDRDAKLSSLDRKTLSFVLHPLLSLRQACCHPQAVRGAFLPLQKTTMTMDELLESLKKKATLECEEAHRQVVAALNGLAGIHILHKQYAEAVEKYREVFRSVEEHGGRIRTDDLQQLHALHNLREVLEWSPPGVAPTLRDHQLAKQAEELREKYMAKVAAKVHQKEESLRPARDSVEQIEDELSENKDWWVELLQWVTYIRQDEALLVRVQEHLRETANSDVKSIANRFRDVRGFQYVLYAQLEDVETSHRRLNTAIQKLQEKPSQDVINQTVECCLRPQGNPLKTCPFCQADKLFSEYESKLFLIAERGVFVGVGEEGGGLEVNPIRQGNWADSEVEKALKSILTFAKSFKADKDLIEFGSTHIRLFEAWKKEFRVLRTVWLALHEQISAIDELSMATTRLRLRFPDEPKTDPPQLNVIDPHEVLQHRVRLRADHAVGQNDLRRKLGQLLYLTNLAKSQGETSTEINPDPCPICQKELGQEWSVLQCGHCYCLDCIRILVDQYSFGGRLKSLRCAMCRELTRHTDISSVSTKPDTTNLQGESAIPVKGSHSTKIEAVVRSLKQIHLNDPTAKSLVFSTWTDVLDKISQALQENHITHRSLQGGRKFQENLHTFRHEEGIQALLLPVHSGANGLNLIEATHVLLVEPLLNTAEEQQAIGRVHRIGQTRHITVIRFLVRSTIEEKIHSLLEPEPKDHIDHKETSLTVGDLVSLLKEDHGLTDSAGCGEQSHDNMDHPHCSTDDPHGSMDHSHGSMDHPHGSMDHPHGSMDHPHGSMDRPHGSMDHPHSSIDRLHGSIDRLRGILNRLHGSMDRPHGSMDRPHGSMDRPHGSMDCPRGSMDRPRGSMDHPHGTMDRPHGSMNRPRGSMDHPQGRMDCLHGGSEQDAVTISHHKKNSSPLHDINHQSQGSITVQGDSNRDINHGSADRGSHTVLSQDSMIVSNHGDSAQLEATMASQGDNYGCETNTSSCESDSVGPQGDDHGNGGSDQPNHMEGNRNRADTQGQGYLAYEQHSPYSDLYNVD